MTDSLILATEKVILVMSRESTNTLIKILFNFVSFQIIGALLIVHLFFTKKSVRWLFEIDSVTACNDCNKDCNNDCNNDYNNDCNNYCNNDCNNE